MAKEQNIALASSKISGNCGRLMCCLKFEHEVYDEKLKRLPKIGAIVKTEDGEGEVASVEILKEQIRVKIKDGEDIIIKKYNANDVKIIKDVEQEDEKLEVDNLEDLKELEELEKLEELDSSNE
jgi:cell fate regulator YaaT (PSP1 superfamily)